MRYLFLIIGLVVFSAFNVSAQHCPFDGGHLVVVHLTDSKGKVISPDSNSLSLVEIDNPQAKSCSYAEGLLKKSFSPNKEFLQTHYKDYWDYWIDPHTKDWNLLNIGYYSVLLNQAEETCMIKNKDEWFDYRKRKFEIHYQENGVWETVKVDKDKVYSLCTGAGKWTRIIPIEIKIE